MKNGGFQRANKLLVITRTLTTEKLSILFSLIYD